MTENLVPIEVLTEMCNQGWGSVPRIRIPDNWRETPGPEFEHAKKGRKFLVPAGLAVERNGENGAE